MSDPLILVIAAFATLGGLASYLFAYHQLSHRVVSAEAGAGVGGATGLPPPGVCVVSAGAGGVAGAERLSISLISTPRFSTTNSTRRLSARPASVWFEITGFVMP